MVTDPETKEPLTIQVKVWNPTIANLTLMALGSSAPEILLSVIETVGTLGETPGELGPSTIVGSAAFNLMVISGISILAVDDGVKKIYDTGVFAITAVSSLWAYIWLLIVLVIWTPDHVSLAEAILTIAFFILLLVLAFAADKYKAAQARKLETKEEKATEAKRQRKLIAKDDLIKLVDNHTYTKEHLLNVAFSTKHHSAEDEKIVELFKTALSLESLDGLDFPHLAAVFEPDNDLQQIRYKRAFGRVLGAKRDFVILKGQVGQAEHKLENEASLEFNDEIGFKSLHYSVSESSK